MAENELEKLKKLSPKERIAKLKELQEKDKKEIADAQRMIRESEEQAATEEELKDIPIPQVKAIDIGELFSAEERDLFKTKRFIEERKPTEELKEIAKREALEETVAAEIPQPTQEEIQAQQDAQQLYQARTEELSQKPADELYTRMRDIYQQFTESGALTPEQAREVGAIQYAQVKKMDDIRQGGYLPSEQAAREMVLTQRMANWLKDKYRA